MSGVVTAPRPMAYRSRSLWAWRALSVAVLVGLWYFAVDTGFIPVNAFSTPSDVGTWLWEWATSGEAFGHVGSTVLAAFLGYVLGVTIGVAVAAAFAFVPGVAPLLEPYMALLNSIPRVVVAPLAVLLLGTGLWAKAFVAVLMVFFVAFFNLYNGFRSVDSSLVNNARVLGASRVRLATVIYLPGVFSWIMSTLRVGIGFAFVGTVVGEFVGGNEGVGFVINLGQQLGQPELTIGGVITLGLVAVVIDRLLVRVENRFSKWRVF